MTRGIAEAFLTAHATYYGWPATFEMINRCAAAHNYPPKGVDLRLVSSKELPFQESVNLSA